MQADTPQQLKISSFHHSLRPTAQWSNRKNHVRNPDNPNEPSVVPTIATRKFGYQHFTTIQVDIQR
jgi:hypothetical protein